MALIQSDWCPYTKRRLKHRQREDRSKIQGEDGQETCRPRREASEEATPANTLILDFQPPES